MIHQHPLAYLVGLEGLALLRGWAGDFDEAWVRARLAEVRRLLDEPALADHPGVDVARGDVATGYGQWAPSYDEPGNGLFEVDEPVVRSILDGLPSSGAALDAACGTGRYTAMLVERGHPSVLGVDGTPEMLEVAQRRVPAATFRRGDLHALPVDDASVDLVTCGIALAHVASLGPAYAELARVVRPGGHVVVADVHAELVFRGSVVKALGPAGEPGLVATHRHSVGDHLRAALAAGLTVLRCEEPGPSGRDDVRGRAGDLPPPAPVSSMGGWEGWPWTLLGLVPEAARAAWSTPSIVVWHFQRPGSTR